MSSPQVVSPDATVKAVTMYSMIRSFGIVVGNSSKYKESIVALGKYIPVS